METLLIISAIACGLIGIIGSVVPILPGPALSFVGLLCAYLSDGSSISKGMLWMWGAITAVVSVMDYILPGYFSKVFGGSKAGITGATLGVFVGLFMGPIGIILGPFAGAVLGEMLNQHRTLDEAVKVGFGSLISFIVGTGLKLVVAGMMTYYIAQDLAGRIEWPW